MSKDGQNGGREPIKIAQMSFAPETAQGPNNGGLDIGQSTATSRDVNPRKKVTLEYHPWRRQYRVVPADQGVPPFYIHESRVGWAIDLADWKAAEVERERAKKVQEAA